MQEEITNKEHRIDIGKTSETVTRQKKLSRAPEVAEFLNVTTQRIYELARNNQLPGTIKLGERQYRFDLEVIAEHIQKTVK